jgi:hypothetical protein
MPKLEDKLNKHHPLKYVILVFPKVRYKNHVPASNFYIVSPWGANSLKHLIFQV